MRQLNRIESMTKCSVCGSCSHSTFWHIGLNLPGYAPFKLISKQELEELYPRNQASNPTKLEDKHSK